MNNDRFRVAAIEARIIDPTILMEAIEAGRSWGVCFDVAQGTLPKIDEPIVPQIAIEHGSICGVDYDMAGVALTYVSEQTTRVVITQIWPTGTERPTID